MCRCKWQHAAGWLRLCCSCRGQFITEIPVTFAGWSSACRTDFSDENGSVWVPHTWGWSWVAVVPSVLFQTAAELLFFAVFLVTVNFRGSRVHGLSKKPRRQTSTWRACPTAATYSFRVLHVWKLVIREYMKKKRGEVYMKCILINNVKSLIPQCIDYILILIVNLKYDSNFSPSFQESNRKSGFLWWGLLLCCHRSPSAAVWLKVWLGGWSLGFTQSLHTCLTPTWGDSSWVPNSEEALLVHRLF